MSLLIGSRGFNEVFRSLRIRFVKGRRGERCDMLSRKKGEGNLRSVRKVMK